MDFKIDLSCDPKKILVLELKRKDITHAYLAEELSEITGKMVTKASVDNKLSRGNFSAEFFLQVLRIIASKST